MSKIAVYSAYYAKLEHSQNGTERPRTGTEPDFIWPCCAIDSSGSVDNTLASRRCLFRTKRAGTIVGFASKGSKSPGSGGYGF